MFRTILAISVLAVLLSAPAVSAGTGQPAQGPLCPPFGMRAPGGPHIALYQPCTPRGASAEGGAQAPPPCAPPGARQTCPRPMPEGPSIQSPPPEPEPAPCLQLLRSTDPTDVVNNPCSLRNRLADGPTPLFYSEPSRTMPGLVKDPCKPYVTDCFYLDA